MCRCALASPCYFPMLLPCCVGVEAGGKRKERRWIRVGEGMGLWADWPREEGGTGLQHLGYNLTPGPVGLIQTTQICARYFTGADPSIPIGGGATA